MVPNATPSPRARTGAPSLRTELLIQLGLLAVGAVVLAVPSAAVASMVGVSGLGLALLGILVVADAVVFIAFGRYLVTRLVTRPLDALVDATQAVADGALSRRAPAAGTREFDRLAESVNRMTDRLLDAQGLLVRAEKLASVGRLAAGVAHEVGNPLAAIGNYVEVLRRRGADPDLIVAVERETARIDAIVRSLLDYARPRAGTREAVALDGVVAGVVALLDAQGVLRGIALGVDAAAGLSAVHADRAGLEQVFVNLLLNAVDAAGSGGAVRVRLTAAAHGNGAVVATVEDSGPGVPVELRERVFDPFFTTKAPGRGTGLGLAIVQRIVHDHGGRVDVGASTLGGAALTVTLPTGPA